MKFLIPIGIAVGAGIIGYVSYYFLGADNPVEEECEKVIQEETGLKIDLSSPAAPSASVEIPSPEPETINLNATSKTQ